MSEFNISVLIMRDNMIIPGEIYTTGKNFTLPPAVTVWTNLTSGKKLLPVEPRTEGHGEHLKISSRT